MQTKHSGFTLLEILLVVGIIAILAGIVIIAINPSKQLAQVRNTERKSDLKQLYNGMTQFYIDKGYYPASTTLSTTTLTTICPTGASTSPAAGFDCVGMLNLSELVPTYIVSIPNDPATTTINGYSVMLVNKQPAVSAPLAELGVTVSVGNVPTAWTCGSTLTDTRDSKTYTTVLIGSQCWMQQNLNVGTKVTGVTTQTNNAVIEKYCNGDDENNCTTYGGIYQWNEMMGYINTAGTKGICPTGWHIPTDTEYKTLIEGQATLGCESSTGWQCSPAASHLSNLTLNHDNASGFTILLAGNRTNTGSFSALGVYAYLMSSSESSGLAWIRDFNSSHDSVYRATGDKTYGFSVRCLRD